MITDLKQDQNQNFWQLACIQTASLGIPGIIISKTFAIKYGIHTAITSIFIANLLLWFIGFTIVSMTAKNRKNAIENTEEYIGKFGSIVISLISMVIFPVWSVLQMKTVTQSIENLYGESCKYISVVSIIIFGILISILTRKRIIGIVKSFTLFFLPLLICYHLFALFSANTTNAVINIKNAFFSLPCTVSYILFLFAGMVNLPTFFKHARSVSDSYLALTFITFIVIFFQITSIWMDSSILSACFFKSSTSCKSLFSVISNIIFFALLLFSNTLVNIYFSHPSWINIIPKLKNHGSFALIGLFIILLYSLSNIFPQLNYYINFFQITADPIIANLGLVLLIIFGARFVVRHRPQPNEKIASTVTWLIGCFVIVLTTIQKTTTPPVLIGIGTTIIFFILIMFIEELVWSLKNLNQHPIE